MNTAEEQQDSPKIIRTWQHNAPWRPGRLKPDANMTVIVNVRGEFEDVGFGYTDGEVWYFNSSVQSLHDDDVFWLPIPWTPDELKNNGLEPVPFEADENPVQQTSDFSE